MSEYLFGVGVGHLGKKAARIAKMHGVELINFNDPGCRCGYGCIGDNCPATARHWFAGHQAGTAVEAAKQVAGVAKVIHVDAPHLENQLGENLAEQVLALASNYSHILAPATAVGKNTLPRVAAKLDVAQVPELQK